MKTTRRFPFVLTDTPAKWLRNLSFAIVLAAAGLAHAQGFSSLPPSVALYHGETVTYAFSLPGWNGSNVTVAVEGPATATLVTAAVNPASGAGTSRNLVLLGNQVGGPLALRLIAAETPTAVHIVTNTINVTVREKPTVAYSDTTGFHDGHIDQDSTSARLTVTRNAVATVLWGKHSNTALFPSTRITPTGSTFRLNPLDGRAGTDIFTVYVTDAFGGWTNSFDFALTVVPVPTIKGLQGSVTFDEDTAGTNIFSVSYGGNPNLLTYTVAFSPTNLMQSTVFLPRGGISTNLALVMYPYANANGNATATLVASDGTHVRTNTFAVTVNPVPDPPSITGLPAEIFISNKDPWTNAFASVTLADPDDNRPIQEKLDVFVSDPRLQLVFDNSTASAVSSLNQTISSQNTWLRAITLKAADSLFGVAGSTNDIAVTMIAASQNDSLAVTNTMLVHLYFKNTPPEFSVDFKPGQGQMNELETRAPFTLTSINDPDATQTSFTLSLFLAPGYEAYGTLSKSVGAPLPPAGGVIGTGNRAVLDDFLQNTQFNAGEGVLTTSQGGICFIFELNDGFDTTVKTNTITLNQLQRPPAINLGNGAPRDIYITSAAPTATPYPLVYVTDPDEAGNQPVRASINSSPNIGEIDMTTRGSMGVLQPPSTLSGLLRNATFTPSASALDSVAVGQSISTRITLTVTDETGLTAANNEVLIHIEHVNVAPELRVPEEQPVLFSPGVAIRPFADVQLSSDDTNAVTFTFYIDDPAKGVFGNIDVSESGFSAQGTDGYTITTANINHILNLVTNITFTPSASYPFPPDDPYGTLFTLSAKDYQFLTTTRTLALQVQDPPRNWLVTKLLNDGTPGTFQHALEHFANNDVITFALASYPATIRMPAAAPVIETGRTLTIKGPGADLLTVSGDSDGNGTPDRQILVISSPVAIEGITFASATADEGGAFSITPSGRLMLRNVVIRDSIATQYGGAIDVFGGQLFAEGCAFLRNSVTEEGYGGGAISTFTDYDIGITNTLFDSNTQCSLNGAGGAVFTEFPDESLDDYACVDIVYCTFADNYDASADYAASSIFAGSGTIVFPLNTIFADDPFTRTLNLDSGAAIWSLGGNICDDSTYVPNQQQGPDGNYSNYLLDSDYDHLDIDARLTPLDASSSIVPYRMPMANSPAIGFASPVSAMVLDQRGLLRVPDTNGLGASGAVDPAARSWLAITEIQLSAAVGDTDQFIELFVPRNGQDVNLAGFSLFLNGVAVHEFGRGILTLTNSVYTTLAPAANIPESYILAPGRGVVVVFPKGETADFTGFSPLNPTPVVRGSIVTNAAEFTKLLFAQGRGSVAVAKSGKDAPIVRQTFLTVFNDPDSVSGTNLLDTAHNSIVSAPQGRGFAFIPHSSVSAQPHGGWRGRPSVTPPGALFLQSPGATVDSTPFGLSNATPYAVSDILTLTEDDLGVLDVLENDLDADGNDRLVIVDVSTTSEPDAGDAATTLSQLGATVTMMPSSVPLRGITLSYDPRGSVALQALPVGVEVLDTFYYEIIDIGSAAADTIAGGTPSNTWGTASHHRLNTGALVVLSGASVAAYNGEFEVAVLDENTFMIPVPFSTVADEPGVWETVDPRTPSVRSEAAVTVRVTGVNDAPFVGGDVVTNVTEASIVRIMVRPDLADMVMSLPSDPVPPPVPNPAHLLDNDDDIDTDDTWQTLRLVGVMGTVQTILHYSGTPGQTPVTIHSPAHGLSSGTEILLANYGGHPSYNDYHTVTVIDADTFTIPRFFADNDSAKGVWVVLNDSNRYHAVTDVGATIDLMLRADAREDHLIYDASASAFLNGLAEGEIYTNRFYQAVADSHGAIGIGPIDIVVTGLNDTPEALPDPAGISVLNPLVTPSNTLESVLSSGLDILYTLPPASCTTGRVDIQTLDRSGTLPGTIVLPDFWATDEVTPIAIQTAALLANDTDIDRLDVLQVSAVEALSREGASLTLGSGQIVYDPSVSHRLQALARDEQVIDSFYAAVTDTMTGGTVTSLVAVLVTGINDTPVAQPDTIELSEDDVFAFNPILHPTNTPALHDYDLDINGLLPDDRLTIIAVSNLITTGEARVSLQPLLAQYDATASEWLNQLADWQTYTDSFEYTITDNSFLFIVDDEFYVPTNTVGRTLDVLANDRDFTPLASTLTIVDVGPTLMGGTVTIALDGSHLIYSSPTGVAVDDFFRYVVTNGAGNRRSARVRVRSVIPPQNGILSAANDHYIVAYGETAVLNVLANDNMLPANGAGLVLATNVVETSMPGQPVVSGNAFLYTATNGLSPLTFTYEVSAGGVSVARAAVVVDIIDRRGTLNVQNDTLSVPAGSLANELAVLANDNLITGTTDHLRIAELIDPAAFGTAAINASATALVYTPNPDFVGVEQLRYLVSDGSGGTGTGVVSVSVGKVDTMIDFFTVAASTNNISVSLDVLANDRVLPFPIGGVTLVSATPINTAIGTMQVSSDHTRLEFTPSNKVGQVDFVYVVSDSTARTATGSVTIATVQSGIYANTDRFMVRKGGANCELNVLANDRSCPDVNKSYSIVSIGAGAEAPNAGGSVSIVNNRLLYTPAAGFIGQESFTYMMSDSVEIDSAWVTVTVSPGDLVANADHFGVFYELESGSTNAHSFTLPVLFNDRIQPPSGQAVQISGLGIGANAPDHLGEVSIGEDGVSLVYRPTAAPSTSYIERFTYEISDGTDRRASAVVKVQVFNREDRLEALAKDDAFTVARNSVGNVLPLLRNDFAQPGTVAGWSITAVSATTYGGAVSISGTNVLYTPADDFVGLDEFTYSVNDGLGGTGSAIVRVRVGAQPTLPDLFVVLSGSESNDLDVTANDALTDEYADEYRLASVFGATHGGSAMLSPSNTVLYAPAASYAGTYPYTEFFFYTVSDDADGVVTGTVQVIVHETGSDQSTTTVTVHVEGRNDIPVIFNDPVNTPITDQETATPFTGVTFIEVDQQTLERVDVLVCLDDAAKGTLRDLGSFIALGGGCYGLTNVTAAYATAQIRNLVFVPTENRITVPATETTRFTLSVTDNKSAPVLDTRTAIDVTAVNDPPVISGTRAGQTVYAATPIRLFSSLLIQEVDDLRVQPLDVTIRLSDPTHGLLNNLGSFVLLSNGVYGATGLTAAAATQQLRLMEFLYGAYIVQPGSPQITVFRISVDDHFADPVEDNLTSVLAYNAFEDISQPTNTILKKSFGFAVDTISDFAVAGAPFAAVNGSDSGSALVYRLLPGTTNSWEVWPQLQPGSIDASDKFGYSVAISEDLIAVGAIQDEVNGLAVGTVYLFQRDLGGSNNWGQLIRIAPTNLPASSQFGFAVDLDGDLLAVGAPTATDAGAVLLFGRHKGGTNAWGEIMRWEPAGQTSREFGTAISLSGDHLVVGAPKNITGLAAGTPLGAAYFLSRQEGGTDNWGLVQRIVATNLTKASDFGYCVSVDRDILAIGAPKVDFGNPDMKTGQVFLYQKMAGSNGWTEISRLDKRNDQGSHFGHSLSVNKDFVMIASRGQLYDKPTYLYLYRHSPLDVSPWQQVERITCPVSNLSMLVPSAVVSFKSDVAIVGITERILRPYQYTGVVQMYRFKFNNAPVLVSPVADQEAEWNEPFSFTIPDGIFADPDVGDTLTVQMALPPSDHGLDVTDMTIAGAPTAIGTIPVIVTATDESNGVGNDTFNIVVYVDGILLEATARNLWNLDNFGRDAANPNLESLLWGNNADPDGDTLNNDQEYVFNGNPRVYDICGLINLTTAADGSSMVISYVRRKDDPTLTYTVQGTASLSPLNWVDVSALLGSEQTTVIDKSYEQVDVTVDISAAGPIMFFRIHVTH